MLWKMAGTFSIVVWKIVGTTWHIKYQAVSLAKYVVYSYNGIVNNSKYCKCNIYNKIVNSNAVVNKGTRAIGVNVDYSHKL